MEAEIFIPFVFFGFLAAIILVPIMAKERTRRSAHELIARAMDKGQQLDPSTIAKLSDDMVQGANNARRSLGKGVILLALAGGLVGAAYASDGGSRFGDHGIYFPAIVLGALGAAYVLLAIVDYVSKPRNA